MKKEKQTFWKNLTWSKYVVWNEAHKNFIKIKLLMLNIILWDQFLLVRKT